jgi:hypothetical protein
VLELQEGEGIDHQRGVIQRADGSTRRVQPCPYPHYDRDGNVVGEPGTLPTINGWLAQESTSAVGPIDWLQATWTVPDYPATGGATIYFFPGAEPASRNQILQPVLGYNPLDGPTNVWTVSSWDCCIFGNNSHGPFITVTPGQNISGQVAGSGCNAQGVCSQWMVTTTVPSGASSTFPVYNNTEPMNWVGGGVLETGNVSTCAQLPADLSLTFNSIQVQGINPIQWLSPPWSPSTASTNPNCLATASATTGTTSSVTLGWWPSNYPKPSPPTWACGVLFGGEGLTANQAFWSCDGRFKLVMQDDGNLVLYHVAPTGSFALWQSDTWHKGAGWTADNAIMQTDGNFVVYSPTAVQWASNTWNQPGSTLAVQTDGNLVVYNPSHTAIWASNTWGNYCLDGLIDPCTDSYCVSLGYCH